MNVCAPCVERLDDGGDDGSQRKTDKNVEACEDRLKDFVRSDFGTSGAEESLTKDDIDNVEDECAGIEEYGGCNA